jgi:curved DNA-binding protein CbpA
VPAPNPYEILKLPRDATVGEIEDAYDRLFDRYEAKAQSGDQAAIDTLNSLNQARDTLVDPLSRGALDKSLDDSTMDDRPKSRSANRPATNDKTRAPGPGNRSPVAGRRAEGELSPVKTRPRSRYVGTRPRRSLASMIPFFIIVAFLLFALAVTIGFLLNRGSTTTTGADNTAVVATVNEQPIYQDDYDEQVNKDKTNALNDPMFGALFNNFQGITGTRALEELKFDSLDKLINMQVIMEQAKKEGAYPTEPQIDGLVQQAQASDLKNGQSFDSFLQQHNITADHYRRVVAQNVVYTVMANQHMPQAGTDDERTQGFIDWVCTTRKNYEVKILTTFTINDNPSCTSGLPSDLPLPGLGQTQVPEPEATAGTAVTPGARSTPQSAPQATPKAP